MREIDFFQDIETPDGAKAPLGRIVYSAINAYPQGHLSIPAVVKFGGFANRVYGGGVHDVAELDQRLLVRIVCRGAPAAAVIVLDALGLTDVAAGLLEEG